MGNKKSIIKRIAGHLPAETKAAVKCLMGKGEIVIDEKEELEKLEKKCRRKLPVKISANVLYEKPLALTSQMKDAFYEKILHSEQCTIRNPYVRLNPYGLTPLCALVLFYTKKEYAVRFRVHGDSMQEEITGEVSRTQYHRVPVFGLYAGRENTVDLELLDDNGSVVKKKTITITTKPLPKVLQDIVKVNKKEAISAYSLFFVMGGGEVMPFAFDQAGNVRYFLNRYPKGYGIFLMSKGHIIFPEKDILAPGYENPHAAQIHDMDLMGRVFRTYHLGEGAHHDACEMEEGGNMLFASSSLNGQCEDRVLELDRKTGKAVSKLDTDEIVECKYHDQKDWSHVNTVQYLEKEGAVLICMRNLHSVAKVDWKTKKLLWVMGDPRFWEGTPVMESLLRPEGEVPFHFQSHTARILKEDLDGNPDTFHMIIFDNHWHKRRSVDFFDNDPDSFVNIYTINEKEGTVALFKQYRCPKSKIRSNGILEYERKRVFAMEGNLEPPIDEYLGMIREYDYESGTLYNEYLVRKGFYRAWEGVFEYKELEKPLPLEKEYFLSELPMLELPAEQPEGLEGAKGVLVPEEKQVKYKRSEDMLYIYNKDHDIRHVYLAGENGVYHRDFSNTKQGKKVFAERCYYVIVPLSGLKADTYRIFLDYGEAVYDTERNIVVENREEENVQGGVLHKG